MFYSTRRRHPLLFPRTAGAYRLALAQRFRGGGVCHSPAACGIRGVDFRAQGRAERRLFHAHAVGECEVMRAARNRGGRYAMVLLWFALGLVEQGGARHRAMRAAAARLLAAGSSPGNFAVPKAAEGKIAVLRPLGPLVRGDCVGAARSDPDIRQFPLPIRIGNAFVSYCVYLGKMIYPVGLAAWYPYLKNGWPVWQVAGAIALLAAITALAFIARRKMPYAAVGLALVPRHAGPGDRDHASGGRKLTRIATPTCRKSASASQ